MERRTFLKSSALTAMAASRVLGANDRIRMGLIGCGTRGTMVSGFFKKHDDVEFLVACDADKSRMEATAAKIGAKETVGDYRRILERKDIDAVLVATPDHWHGPITVAACEAGKDVYVEKPISNNIADAQAMLAAARKNNRIVQCGLQQRQGEAFREAAEMIQSGQLGTITHCILSFGGGYATVTQPTEAPPAGFDWDMFQGPAPRRPYSPSYRRWRAYYAYGGGLVTDWGVHLVDVAHWYMKADAKTPLLTSASAQSVNVPNPQKDQVPDAFICSWQYDNFIMSFTNAVFPSNEFGMQGNTFYGTRGVLHVNRSGFIVKPVQGRAMPGGPPPPPPIQARVRPFKEDYNNDPDTIMNARNFLDCVKSRQQPTANIDIGFYSSMPCIIALLAIRNKRQYRWDGKTAVPA